MVNSIAKWGFSDCDSYMWFTENPKTLCHNITLKPIDESQEKNTKADHNDEIYIFRLFFYVHTMSILGVPDCSILKYNNQFLTGINDNIRNLMQNRILLIENHYKKSNVLSQLMVIKSTRYLVMAMKLHIYMLIMCMLACLSIPLNAEENSLTNTQKLFIQKNFIAISKEFLTVNLEGFNIWQTGKLGSKILSWSGYCGLGPYHGGLIIFDETKELLDITGDFVCVKEISNFDINNDDLYELIIYDYGTGTGFQQTNLNILFYNDGVVGKTILPWEIGYEMALVHPSDDNYITSVWRSDISNVQFLDVDGDGFKEQLKITTTTEYAVDGDEEAWMKEKMKSDIRNEIWYWDNDKIGYYP